VLEWSTAILAFLLVGINRASGAGGYFLLFSSVFSIVAVVCSFIALRTRGDWKSPSDESWIHQSAFVREDGLKRYHIRVLHDVKRWRLAITNAKSSSLFAGELSLILASMTLFAGIVYHLLLTKIPWLFAFAKVI
jgi:hypothetical protein